jgi:catechol 2,3-dioxygenase-like lactoylglutathione lyase family enzyme
LPTLGDVSETTAFNHVGQCVTDLARSRRFYEELFGFRCERTLEPPDDPSATLLQIEAPVGTKVAYLRRDGLILELLQFDRTGNPPFRARVMNEPGLTHISLSVEDPEEVAARVPELGGQVVDATRIPGAFFIRDPDGQLLELLPMSYRRRLDGGG